MIRFAKVFSTVLFLVFIIITPGCSRTVVVKTNNSGNVPPGQMKKATGEKSAKKYAPGQQKKNK
ncbi:MAG: Uncharacterized protein FD123_173 [Bacteroidetes bacterium]|nr:MAG: Uncharacterized protein FD123_173 [Bacteroidota bacterium]